MSNSIVSNPKKRAFESFIVDKRAETAKQISIYKKKIEKINQQIDALKLEKENILTLKKQTDCTIKHEQIEYPPTFPAGKNPRARPNEPNHAESVQHWTSMCRIMAEKNEIYPSMRFSRGIERGRHLSGEHYANFRCADGSICLGSYRYRCHAENGKKVYYLRWSKEHTCVK